jgi:transposase
MRKINDDELIQLLKEGRMTQKQMAARFGVSEPAITKMTRKYRKLGLYKEFELPKSFKNLSEKEQKFALALVEGKTQTQAAKEAFECTTEGSARSLGSQLAKDNDIQKVVSELMQEEGLTRRKRIQVLKNHIFNQDPNVSLKALDQTWKLEGLYTEKHVNLNINYADCVKEMEELNREIRELEKELGVQENADSLPQ